jgi:hypothetical protein
MNVQISEARSWGDDSSQCDVLLGAGEGEIMGQVLEKLNVNIPAILVCPSWVPGQWVFRHLPSWPLHHQVVGGATDCRGRMWTRSWVHEGLPPMVRRQLGHLLDHGTLPSACVEHPAFPHLSPQDLFPMDRNLPPVVFPSHATRTKWGIRPLTSKEIGLCLDAPLWVVSKPVLLSLFLQRFLDGKVMPLKMLQAPLFACLKYLDSFTPEEPPAAAVASPLPPAEDSRGSWLASLGKWLPPTWVEAGSLSDKAAKADDAAIHTGLWDARISSVLPLAAGLLVCLRKVAFGWWCGRVGKSLRNYLTKRHGSQWAAHLQLERR